MLRHVSSALAVALTFAVPAATAAAVQPSAADSVTARAESQKTTLIFADFESAPTGRMSPATFTKELGGTVSSYSLDDSSVVDTGGHRGKVYRIHLEKGTIRDNPSGNHGIVAVSELSRKVNQACIRYRVRFSKDFDFSLGGKLPGLEGVAPGVSPSVPAGGGNPGDKGWSGRMMWVGPEAYSWAGPVNMAVSYMYGPEQESTYGDNVRWNEAFGDGRWHRVKQCYRMNTVGRSNGKLRAWMDREKVLEVTDHVYRLRKDVHVSHLMWDVFRGGGTLDWAGSRDGHIDFDNVKVTTRS